MDKLRRSRRELEALIMYEAAASGKCSDLQSICIVGPISPSYGDWRLEAFSAKRNSVGLSFECETELAKIVSRLQRRYVLEGD